MGCLGIIIIAVVLYLTVIFDNGDSESKNIVSNHSYDFSFYQVDNWLKKNLKDPDYLKYIEWSTVIKREDGKYMVRVKYHAKNYFGGYVVENRILFFDKDGTVINNIPYIK